MTPRAKELAITILRIIEEGNLGGGDVGTFAKLDDIIEEIGDKHDVRSVINDFLIPMGYVIKVNEKFKKAHGHELEYTAYQIKELGRTYLNNHHSSLDHQTATNERKIDEPVINRLNQLIADADAVLRTHTPNPPNIIGFPTLEEEAFRKWKASSENIISSICGSDSTYLQSFTKTVKSGHRSHVKAGKGILGALKEDIDAGVYGQPIQAITAVSEVSVANVVSDTVSIKISNDIYSYIRRYLETGDYFHAVEESYKLVREKLKDITAREKASDIFNMNAENTRYHEAIFGKMAEVGSPEADFFRGIGYLNLTIQFLRNEKAHSLATTVDKNLALHYVSLASLAYDLISRGEQK
jgi:uncharacterized protein (TIGR02391 family)